MDRPEDDLYTKTATQHNLEHIARYYHYETVYINGLPDTTLDHIRIGALQTAARTSFRQKPSKYLQVPDNSSDPPNSLEDEYTQSSISITKKRSPTSSHPPSSKRIRSNPQPPYVLNLSYNRVHRRVVMQDAGKPLMSAGISRTPNKIISPGKITPPKTQ